MERKIEILGTSFSIRSTDEPEHLEKVLAVFSRQVEEIGKSLSVKDKLKIAILAGLNIADELVRTADGTVSTPAAAEMGRIATQLIETIDQRLSSE